MASISISKMLSFLLFLLFSVTSPVVAGAPVDWVSLCGSYYPELMNAIYVFCRDEGITVPSKYAQ